MAATKSVHFITGVILSLSIGCQMHYMKYRLCNINLMVIHCIVGMLAGKRHFKHVSCDCIMAKQNILLFSKEMTIPFSLRPKDTPFALGVTNGSNFNHVKRSKF